MMKHCMKLRFHNTLTPLSSRSIGRGKRLWVTGDQLGSFNLIVSSGCKELQSKQRKQIISQYKRPVVPGIYVTKIHFTGSQPIMSSLFIHAYKSGWLWLQLGHK
ncbi:MAG: hypothetical protein FRX49_09400 [Trebouxia sp. A1-2]|nr:MAG: hypothetical protein FRX49_09400 [Trebouxia sp. A1-2]